MCKIIVKFHHRNRITQQALYRAFKLVMTELNTKDVRFHDLRHAYAVISLKSGDDVRTGQTACKPLSSSSADSEESKLQSGEQKNQDSGESWVNLLAEDEGFDFIKV